MENYDYISETTELRQKAEERVKERTSEEDKSSDSDKLKLIHELEVHQIELEMQNEELILTKTAAQNMADKYSRLYDAAPSGFFTLSNDGRIKEVDSFGAHMLGHDPGYLKNKEFALFISGETRPVFNYFLEEIFENKKKETCEITLVSDDNRTSFVFLNGLVMDNGGECHVTVVDITDRKKAEESLLENQRLSIIGEMATSIAHDFNNSLQSMLGNLEMALHAPELSKSTYQYLNVINTLVKDAASRVKQLQWLNGEKQESNQYSPVNLNNLISEMIVQSRPLWKSDSEQKGFNINIITSLGKIPEICGMEVELRSAIFNVFKNSVEALPQGGDITIKTETKPEGILISVSDTGVGMDQETKRRVFQPFYSTKGIDPGRGLGMSGAYNIITDHKGNISVKDTSPGNGTTIEIFFPVCTGKKLENTVGLIEEPNDLNAVIRILWVEDDDSISIVAQEMLKYMGHRGDIARSGKEALEFMDRNEYDLVITDIGMPEMNGWQLAEIIKEKYSGKMKVAVISGWGSQIKEEEKIRNGVIYVLSKPFNLSQLQNLIEKVHHNVN